MDPEDLDALAAQAAEQKIRDYLTGIKSDVGIDNLLRWSARICWGMNRRKRW